MVTSGLVFCTRATTLDMVGPHGTIPTWSMARVPSDTRAWSSPPIASADFSAVLHPAVRVEARTMMARTATETISRFFMLDPPKPYAGRILSKEFFYASGGYPIRLFGKKRSHSVG